MQIRELKIRNFRGIESLDWRPTSPLVCIVGSGDAGKSTLLDAIEAATTSRWVQFSDTDFFGCDTSKPVEIVVTLGELPEGLLRDNRLGLHLRGWSPTGELHDEPEADDEAVVSVRLTVDASLEPTWDVVTERGEPRLLSARDRALLGVVRLGGDADRHLTWGQGSALARIDADRDQAAAMLAEAYRKARELISGGDLSALTRVASRVRDDAVRFGAYASPEYSPGLDTQRASMSMGALALHAAGVPVRLSGLGTRRLVALAIQRMSIPDGGVILIDEVEHGLEPHRIRHALKVLRQGLGVKPGDPGHVGQVIMTTHSAVAVVELRAPQLTVVHRRGGALQMHSPSAQLQDLVRRLPEAFLGRRAIVCEGRTEIGMLRAMRDVWSSRHDDEPIENRGVVLVDGNGAEGPRTAVELARLGFECLLFRDSDLPLTDGESSALQTAGVGVREWPGGVATEERVLLDVSLAGVQAALDLAYSLHGSESVLDSLRAGLGVRERLPAKFSDWSLAGRTEVDIRRAIGITANKKKWFKQIDLGERLGALVAAELNAGMLAPLRDVLSEIEAWAYGG